MRLSHGTPCDDPTPDGPLAGGLGAAKAASAGLLQMAEWATPMALVPRQAQMR